MPDQMLDVDVSWPPLAHVCRAEQPGLCVQCGGRYSRDNRVAKLLDGSVAHMWCIRDGVSDG